MTQESIPRLGGAASIHFGAPVRTLRGVRRPGHDHQPVPAGVISMLWWTGRVNGRQVGRPREIRACP
jgi:hypothetical protein